MLQWLVTHIKGDRVIWLVALFLSVFSLLGVYSSVASLANNTRGGNAEYFLIKHGIILFAGIGLMYVVHRWNYIKWSKFANLLMLVAIILLAMTLMFGSDLNAAKRWLQIPVIGLSIQTSDFAKIALYIFLARKLTDYKEHFGDFKYGILIWFWPIALMLGLILIANFSTAALLFFNSLVIMSFAGVPFKQLGKIVGIALSGFILLVLISFVHPILPRLETWKARIANFQKVEEVSSDADYQIEQAKLAIWHGQMLGQGPGGGETRYTMPHPYSDMIFAFIIEEYGSVFGGILMVLLFVILFFRGKKIAALCDKSFGAILAFGISFGMVVQALVNMLVAVDLIPVTGQPLPLISMGGTSIIFTCLMIGLLLSISRSTTLGEHAAFEGREETNG